MLDLSAVTSGKSYNFEADHDVHYRHYLGRNGKPVVICVQWFDYPDYDPARFLSGVAFLDEEAAYATKIKRRELRAIVASGPDAETRAVALRNLRAADRHRYPVR